MPAMTQAQQQRIADLRASWGTCRTMQLPDGSVLACCGTDTGPGPRYLIPPRPGHSLHEATREQVDQAWRIALAHLRIPCPTCGYPARRPACARCGTLLPDARPHA